MTKRSGLLAASLVAGVVAATAGSRSDAAHGLSTRSPPRFVSPGVTLAIDGVDDDDAEEVLAVTVTLTNGGGIPLDVRYRNFALMAAADERYPALLPSELGSTPRHDILLREGVVAAGESLSAVLFFRAPPLGVRLLELRVELADVHDTPIGRAFLPIVHAGPRSGGTAKTVGRSTLP